MSLQSHFGLLESVVRSAECQCVGELCYLGHRRRVGALCLLYKIHHRTDHPMHEQRYSFVAARHTRDSAAVGVLALVIQSCRTDQFSRSL